MSMTPSLELLWGTMGLADILVLHNNEDIKRDPHIADGVVESGKSIFNSLLCTTKVA